MTPLNEPLLESWLANSLFIPDDLLTLVEATSELLFLPFLHSKTGIGFFLKKAVNPHQFEDVQWKAHAAEPGGIDFLRCEYVAAGLQLGFFEGINLVLVRATRVEETLAEAANKQAYVTNLVETMVETDTEDHRWDFEYPLDFETSWDQRLIASKDAVPLSVVQTRHDRADILILDETAHFVFYKKIGQLIGFQADDGWFSLEARAALKVFQ